MRTYTVFFQHEETPHELRSSEGVGSLRLIDGIAVSQSGPHFGFSLGCPGKKKTWIPFSTEDPPPILNNYVVACEIERGAGIRITRSPDDQLLERSHELAPVLVRVHTLSQIQSPKKGFVSKLDGDPQIITTARGTNRTSQFSVKWSDSLIILSMGDALHVRPAGTSDAREWVVEYPERGISFSTLEEYYNRK